MSAGMATTRRTRHDMTAANSVPRGIRLALLCSLLLILGVAAPASAENLAGPSDASRARGIRRVDEALARGDRSGAEWVWHDACAKALAAREWEGMLAVGDAYLRIGAAAHGRKMAEMGVRTLYLAALYRARQEGVLDGALEAAERFLQLVDREMVTQCLAVADRLAVGSRAPRDHADVEIFRARWDTRSLLAPRPAWETPTLFLFPDASVGP